MLAVVRAAMLAAGRVAPCVSLVLKADERAGASGALQAKVAAVEGRLRQR